MSLIEFFFSNFNGGIFYNRPNFNKLFTNWASYSLSTPQHIITQFLNKHTITQFLNNCIYACDTVTNWAYSFASLQYN